MKERHILSAIALPEIDRVTVRGKDLCSDLIGQVGLTDYFLFLLSGTEPTPVQTRMVEACIVAIAEHGLVPSVQAARMTLAAAPEAWQGAVAAGLLGCGSVILGSSEVAGAMLGQIIATAESSNIDYRAAARGHVAELKETNRALPGFGHPLHRPQDPRAIRLLLLADELGVSGKHVGALRAVIDVVEEAYGRPLPLNVSGAIPATLLDAGFPMRALKGIPLVARAVSLVAHLLEESERPIGFALAAAGERAAEYDGKFPARAGEAA